MKTQIEWSMIGILRNVSGDYLHMLSEFYWLIVLLHLLLFVYWLGADVGVFYSARYVQDRSLSLESRRTALRIMGWIDQLPRYCLVLMLPVGTTLAVAGGALRLGGTALAAFWLIGLAWLGVVYAIHHFQGTPLADRLRQYDLVWRVSLVIALIGAGVSGLLRTGPIVTDWLAIKLLLFAALVFCGIMIRMFGKPIGPALRKILSEGSSEELEAQLARGFTRTRPFVLAIWVLLLLTAYVGLTKPMLS